MVVDWRNWLGLNSFIEVEGYKYSKEGVPLCGCHHPKNNHISICYKMFCPCTQFTHARVMNG